MITEIIGLVICIVIGLSCGIVIVSMIYGACKTRFDSYTEKGLKGRFLDENGGHKSL